MLRITEEILLLIIDTSRRHTARAAGAPAGHRYIAGAALMDLALENRIDTDSQQLVVTDPTPLDDDRLDPTLADIERETAVRDTGFRIKHTAGRSADIRGKALARLTASGILEADANGLVSCRAGCPAPTAIRCPMDPPTWKCRSA